MLEPPDATLRCTQCSHQAVWSFQLDNHIKRYHNGGLAKQFHGTAEPEHYRCVCCHFRISSKLGLHEHCISKHNTLYLQQHHQPGKEFDRFLCGYCEYNGNSSLHLLKHQVTCETARRALTNNFEFALCGYKTESNRAPAEEPFWYACGKCLFRCKRKSVLTTHKYTHAVSNKDKEWFNCDKCSYRTIRIGHLRQHMRKHATKSRFDCVRCPLRFRQETQLKKHVMLQHAQDDIVLFQCDKCTFGSLSKSGLKEHKLVHVDWSCCTKCSYRASKESYLERHMLLHTKADDAKWASFASTSEHAKEQGCLKTQMRQRMLQLLKSPK